MKTEMQELGFAGFVEKLDSPVERSGFRQKTQTCLSLGINKSPQQLPMIFIASE